MSRDKRDAVSAILRTAEETGAVTCRRDVSETSQPALLGDGRKGCLSENLLVSQGHICTSVQGRSGGT